MLKVKIISVGKNSESWLQEALAEYEKRLSKDLKVEWILSKTTPQFEKILQHEPSYIALDPQGRLLSSPQFSSVLMKEFEKNKSTLTFAIGGAEGLSEVSRQKASWLLSLSPMVFTHQITRLILIEQIYRAFQIERKGPYHK